MRRSPPLSKRLSAKLVVFASLAFGLASLAGGCSLVVNDDLKKGVGSVCTSDTDCQGSSCSDGICTLDCKGSTDCPSGTVCATDGTCQRELRIGAIFIGNSGEGWTKTHGDGLAEVAQELGFPKVTYKENVIPGDDTQQLIEDYISAGNQVIIATSTSYSADINEIAPKHPDVKFLVCEGTEVTDNVGSYYGRREQAWYLAGKVAAQKTNSKLLGIIGSFVSPDTVRNINAFTLGARSVDASILVEVRWSGFWFDYLGEQTFSDEATEAHWTGLCRSDSVKQNLKKCFLEEYLAAKLIEGGADVITHQADVARANNLVQSFSEIASATPPIGGSKPDVFGIANNNQYGCSSTGNQGGSEVETCLASVYWNWTPLYTQLFTEIKSYKWVPSNIYESIQEDASRSIVGVQLSDVSGIDKPTFNSQVAALARESNPYVIFKGPYATNDRDANGDGTADFVDELTTISEDEVLHMCWFVDGVVERMGEVEGVDRRESPDYYQFDNSIPISELLDKYHLQPAKVPNGGANDIPWKALAPFGEEGPAAFSWKAHGG